MSDPQTPVPKDPVLEELIAQNLALEFDCPDGITREGTIYPIGDAGYQFIFWQDESEIKGFRVASEDGAVKTVDNHIIGYKDKTILSSDGIAVYSHALGYAERRERMIAALPDAIAPPMPEHLHRP